jgi:Sulfotransferase domain
MAAPRAVVVSLRKSGTHLMREVVSALGYTPLGAVAGDDQPMPRLGRKAAWRAMRAVYTLDELSALARCEDRGTVDRAVREAVDAYVDAWQTRLGVRRGAGARPGVRADLLARALTAPTARRFDDTPEGYCWFLHELDLDRVDPDVLHTWAATGQPPIIFLYRDLRDVLLSMVDFLAGTESTRLGSFPEHHVYAAIMRSVGTVQERLTIALTDPSFPGMAAYVRSQWMIRHPGVCRVSFEDLVGDSGGGSAAGQRAAVARIAAFLGVEADPNTVAQNIFNPHAYTFHKGQIGRWRQHFTPEHRRLFDERYGRVAAVFAQVEQDQ